MEMAVPCWLATWSFPKIRGPQYGPQNTIVLIIGTPKNGTPNFGKPYLDFHVCLGRSEFRSWLMFRTAGLYRFVGFHIWLCGTLGFRVQGLGSMTHTTQHTTALHSCSAELACPWQKSSGL